MAQNLKRVRSAGVALAVLAGALTLSACTHGAAAVHRTISSPPVISTVRPSKCSQSTTIGLDGCAANALRAGDLRINRLVASLYRSFTPQERRDFRRSERLWLQWRQAHCRVVTDTFRGGSIVTVELLNCAASADRSYSAQLLSLYQATGIGAPRG